MTTPTVTDEQRERHIQACGEHMLACYAAGDREMAKCWLAAQNAAIRERSEAQKRRMAVAAGLPTEDGCFFAQDGLRARTEAKRHA